MTFVRKPSTAIKQQIRDAKALRAKLWRQFRAETRMEFKDTLAEDLCVTARWIRSDMKRLAKRWRRR